MAVKKNRKGNLRSGFDAPAIGEVLPKGTTFKKNKDGTVTPIYPKSSGTAKKSSKK